MNKTADSLVQECTVAARNGADFPAIWESILRDHGLVASPPIETFDDEKPHIEVRLINGFWLRYCACCNDFSLRRAALHRCF